MGFIASLKGNLAMRAHNRGDLVKAKALYKEAVDKGLMECKPMLAYSLLLIREGSYEEAMALLLKTQKAPDLTPDRKSQLFVDYAACCAKTGQLDKGVKLLERQHQLDLAAEIRMRRQVDFLMESQRLKKEEPKEEIWDDQ